MVRSGASGLPGRLFFRTARHVLVRSGSTRILPVWVLCAAVCGRAQGTRGRCCACRAGGGALPGGSVLVCTPRARLRCPRPAPRLPPVCRDGWVRRGLRGNVIAVSCCTQNAALHRSAATVSEARYKANPAARHQPLFSPYRSLPTDLLKCLLHSLDCSCNLVWRNAVPPSALHWIFPYLVATGSATRWPDRRLLCSPASALHS